MFRPMAAPRAKQQISEEECIQILKEQKRGILCVLGDDDYPYGTPTNHFYNEADGKIYFHSNKKGHKVDAMKKHDKICFVCYDEGFKKEGDWALNIKSVIVFGKVEFIPQVYGRRGLHRQGDEGGRRHAAVCAQARAHDRQTGK